MPKHIRYPKRMLKLADMLDADAKNKRGIKFDIEAVGMVVDVNDVLSCGTQACAMGLAGLSGKFKAQGLDYRLGGHFIQLTWNGRKLSYGTVGARLFGISEDDSFDLFRGSGSGLKDNGKGGKAERALAKALRAFVAGKNSPRLPDRFQE